MNKKMVLLSLLPRRVHPVKTLYYLGYTNTLKKNQILQCFVIYIYFKLQIRFLEKDGNPRLTQVPILFTSKSPLGNVEPLVELDESRKEVNQHGKKVPIE